MCIPPPTTAHRPPPTPRSIRSARTAKPSPPRCRPIRNRKYNNPSCQSSHAGRHKENSVLHKSNSDPIPPLALLLLVKAHRTVPYSSTRAASSGELAHLTLGTSMLSLTRTQFFTPSVVQSQNPISQPTITSSFLLSFLFPSHFSSSPLLGCAHRR